MTPFSRLKTAKEVMAESVESEQLGERRNRLRIARRRAEKEGAEAFFLRERRRSRRSHARSARSELVERRIKPA
jgi:hypothetical protein